MLPQNSEKVDLRNYVQHISSLVNHIPATDIEFNTDIALAQCAAAMAVERHAGILKQEYSIQGEMMVQYGKNIMSTENIIGTDSSRWGSNCVTNFPAASRLIFWGFLPR
jgi:hypothetical protein